jgi:transcriptional regulator with XRE-family HTH domain
MRTLHENLELRKRELRLTIGQIHAKLALLGVNVSPSAVGHWFNGRGKPRDMDHLKALCEVLETSISVMAGEDPEFARNGFESTLLKESRNMNPAMREAVLAIIKANKGEL